MQALPREFEEALRFLPVLRTAQGHTRQFVGRNTRPIDLRKWKLLTAQASRTSPDLATAANGMNLPSEFQHDNDEGRSAKLGNDVVVMSGSLKAYHRGAQATLGPHRHPPRPPDIAHRVANRIYATPAATAEP